MKKDPKLFFYIKSNSFVYEKNSKKLDLLFFNIDFYAIDSII